MVSLVELLRGREASSGGGGGAQPIFTPGPPVVNEAGVDFTSSGQFKNYTGQCLGDGIKLEQYVVEVCLGRIKLIA